MQNMGEPLVFGITNIQTITLPIPREIFTLDRNRRFFVSATDGMISKTTRMVLIDENRSLLWTDTLDGFTVKPSSQLTLSVFESFAVRNDTLRATFVVPYNTLRSSGNVISVESDSKKKPASEISVTLSRRYFLGSDRGDLPASSTSNDMAEASYSHNFIVEQRSNGIKKISGGMARIALDKWDDFVRRLDFVVKSADLSEIRPYAEFAWSTISSMKIKDIWLDKDVLDLIDAMRQSLDLAPDPETLWTLCDQLADRRRTVVCMMDLITECGYFIQSYIHDPEFPVTFGNRSAKLQELLRQLHDAFHFGAFPNVDLNTIRVFENMAISRPLKAGYQDPVLKLPLIEDAAFDPEKGCLPRTRVKFLDAIMTWVNNVDPNSPKAMILFGQAGTGKSSIAHEIANRFHLVDRLTTSYFFIRKMPSSRQPHRFFTTLARNLCSRYPMFKVLANVGSDVFSSKDSRVLFEDLILQPLQYLRFLGPIFIVIDALDESENVSAAGIDVDDKRVSFHAFLAEHLARLPSNFRFLITSRPEANILNVLPESSLVRHMQMDDPQFADGSEGDIQAYILARLSRTGIDSNEFERLAMRANGLFQWAYMVCGYIARPPPGLTSKDCLRLVQRTTAINDDRTNALDKLCITVINSYTTGNVPTRFWLIIRQILASFEPLSMDSLYILAQQDPEDAKATGLDGLLSLFTNTSSQTSTVLLHSSLCDFFTDERRSDKFFVNLDEAHCQLAIQTLQTMQTILCLNICRLETSYHLNSEVQGLDKRIEQHISPALLYSCRFWAEHLEHVSGFNVNLFDYLNSLMEEKLLFWLEILSLLGELSVAVTALLLLRAWLYRLHDKNERISILEALVTDAISFVRYFAHPIAQSAPHIYLSALPFSPSSSTVYRLYSPLFPQTFRLESGGLTQWPSFVESVTLPGMRRVTCVAFSWNSRYIAVAIPFWGILIWNTVTGVDLTNTFGDDVSSIAFSKDDKLLAYGSLTGSVRLREVTTRRNAVVGDHNKKLIGHVGAITALAFSQDGEQLISGSADGIVLIWDIKKGKRVGGSADRHNNAVWTVSLLPDQRHLISRSGFRTVQVWDVKTDQRVKTPFNGMDIPMGIIDSTAHLATRSDASLDPARVGSSYVECPWEEAVKFEEERYRPEGVSEFWKPVVAFAHDGKFVATSSATQVHVWHAGGGLAGHLAGGPFNHEQVTCLAFSADGLQIVSGSMNGTVRLWNVQRESESGTKEKIPTSVVFSRDGKQIIIGRQGGAVEVLDVSTGEEVVKIHDDEEKTTYSKIAISPNGELIASACKYRVHISTRLGKPIAEVSSKNEIISVITFPPDSNDIVTFGTEEGTGYFFNISTGMLIGPTIIFKYRVTSLSVCPSNDEKGMTDRSIAVGLHRRLIIWDTRTGYLIGPASLHKNITGAVLFSDDAKHVVSVSQDYTLCVWDPLNGKLVKGPVGLGADQTLYAAKSSRCVALTQDGKRVAFVGKCHTILVFDSVVSADVISLHGPLLLAGHTAGVNSMAFSGDGQLLVSTSEDHMTRIWDLRVVSQQQKSKQAFIDTNTDSSEIVDLNEVFFNNEGWAFCVGRRSTLRLMWIPSNYRASLRRPNDLLVAGQGWQKEIRLGMKHFVHGQGWDTHLVECSP